MKQGKWWITIFFGLGVIGIFAFLLATVSTVNNRLVLSSMSPEPGGSMALYQLLEAEGIPVERAMKEPKDVSQYGMAISYDGDYNVLDEITGNGTITKDMPVILVMRIQSQLQKKENAKTVNLISNYNALPRSSVLAAPEDVLISTVPGGDKLFFISANTGVISSRATTNGYRVYIPTGQAFLNRFIGMEDNATIIVSLVKALLPKGKKVMFPEYLFTKSEQGGMFATLGPAFTAFVIQLLFLFFLLIYAFGKRFGYPITEEIKKPGSAEFVSAMSETFRRGKASEIVLETEYKRAMRAISKKLNLPPEMPDTDVIRRLSASLATCLQQIKQNTSVRMSEKEMKTLLNELKVHLKEYLK